MVAEECMGLSLLPAVGASLRLSSDPLLTFFIVCDTGWGFQITLVWGGEQILCNNVSAGLYNSSISYQIDKELMPPPSVPQLLLNLPPFVLCAEEKTALLLSGDVRCLLLFDLLGLFLP